MRGMAQASMSAGEGSTLPADPTRGVKRRPPPRPRDKTLAERSGWPSGEECRRFIHALREFLWLDPLPDMWPDRDGESG